MRHHRESHSRMKTLSKRRNKASFIPRAPLFQIGNFPQLYRFTVISSYVLTFTRADDCQGPWCLWTCTNSSTSVTMTQKPIFTAAVLFSGWQGVCFMDKPWRVNRWQTYSLSLSLSPSSLLPNLPFSQNSYGLLPFILSWGYIDDSSKLGISCCTQNTCNSNSVPLPAAFFLRKKTLSSISLSLAH